ncbi:winged helix-turn-helix domain-containing protein [Mycobacterium vulneris]|uniref:Winged helix-turn-helix domain-containing protein n=1 Tax=Mycolicibacterium vulneris TaxID=547163 RepID=A0A1X2KKQ5_9MYCO|nr:winged helix-turn-helix domain-containing protein [Mycolicibacterium vulneris]OSC22344.1 winged helix-turn-helix domain-containing protein [Mycolicibacterium vulneris]
MSTQPTNQTLAQKRLAAKAARQRVYERELEREIYDAAVVQGLTQRQISELVGNQSQATIQRILRRVVEDPTKLDVTPAEIIDQRSAGIITTEEMMHKLLNWTYSFGHVAHIDGVATDAYITGDWDSIEMAFYRGQLTDDEFQQLADRQLHANLP